MSVRDFPPLLMQNNPEPRQHRRVLMVPWFRDGALLRMCPASRPVSAGIGSSALRPHRRMDDENQAVTFHSIARKRLNKRVVLVFLSVSH